MPVKKGDKIKVEYEGKLDDGTVFDSTGKHGGEPLEFEAGAGSVIKGFDNAVIGMKKGDEKEINLKPAEAYGEPNEQLVKKVPRSQFPEKMELKAGTMLALRAPNGMQIPAKITEVSDSEVTIDLNHPLAGKNLNFKIKIVGINE
ncbi:peptidylprolyl isomerase [Candidatus Woesearchaeota archaeon]|nr:peptidylprolyl isomerase [Candidatus Woesearchaeota archaeon]